MTCCLIVFALMIPRITLVGMWLTGYGGRAFQGILWPVLGFFFMPFTTCAYAIANNEVGGIHGWGLFLLIVGVVLDLGGHGGASNKRFRRPRRNAPL